MNDFNRGIEYALEIVLNNLKKAKIDNKTQEIITKEKILEIKNNIPLKCDFCTTPCGYDWCSTKRTT